MMLSGSWGLNCLAATLRLVHILDIHLSAIKLKRFVSNVLLSRVVARPSRRLEHSGVF